MMIRKILISFIFIGISLTTLTGYGQDPEFSQFYANPLYLNPAYAGSNVCPRVILNYRNQWPAISKAYVNYNASYDQYIDKLHGGVGLLVNADNAGGGVLKTNTISLMYAYRLQAGKNLYLGMAVQASYQQRSLGWDLLQFGDQIDDQLGFINPTNEQPPDKTSLGYADFGAGIVMDYKGKLYGGVAVHHLTEPEISFYATNETKLPMKITADLGYNISFDGGGGFTDESSDFYMVVAGIYQQQGKWRQVNAGVYVVRIPLVLGTWFRHNFERPDALIFLVGLTFNNIKIGYSYDYSLSNLQGQSGGAHEVSLAYQFNCMEKKRKIKAIKCPQF